MRFGRVEIDRFYSDGYVVLRGVFREREIDVLRRAFSRLERSAANLGDTRDHRGSRFVLDRDPDGSVRIRRIVWCAGAEPVLGAFGSDRRLLRPAAELLGSDALDHLICQAHFKLPGDEVEFPWHQDSRHRRYGTAEWSDVNGRGSYVQTVLAIDPVRADNGPLRLIPGSCRWGHVDEGDDRLATRIDPRESIAPDMDPGDVLLFGPYTVHGSSANRSPRPRRILINGFAYPGANRRVYPGCGTGRALRCPRPARRA